MIIFLVSAALFLAFSNGANDNFKGFATIWGSGTLSYRSALILSNLATLAGGAVSLILADGLIKQFTGRGLVDDTLAASAAFSFAVATGASLTVMIATRLGFPISTTHALVGGLTGAGLASGSALQWGALGSGFILPLLISPFLSAIAAYGIYGGRKLFQKRLGASLSAGGISVSGDSVSVNSQMFNTAHIITAVAICFARAVNDTPKLAALLLGAGVLSGANSAIGSTIAMVLGGWLLSRRVAETMSMKISHIAPSQGIVANCVTAALVLSASRFGLPVSTTHVSVGSIIGSGAAAGNLDLATVRNVLLSWLVTLPLSAAISAVAAWLALN